jgi:hypothetical protein
MISKEGIAMLGATEVACQLFFSGFSRHTHNLLCGELVRVMVLAKYILASLFTRFTLLALF